MHFIQACLEHLRECEPGLRLWVIYFHDCLSDRNNKAPFNLGMGMDVSKGFLNLEPVALWVSGQENSNKERKITCKPCLADGPSDIREKSWIMLQMDHGLGAHDISSEGKETGFHTATLRSLRSFFQAKLWLKPSMQESVGVLPKEKQRKLRQTHVYLLAPLVES